MSWRTKRFLRIKRIIGLFVCLFAFSTEALAGRVIFTLSDDVIREKLDWVCGRAGSVEARLDCEGKSDSEVVEEAIDKLLCGKFAEYAGFCAWSPKRHGGIYVEVELDFDPEDEEINRQR